MLESRRPRNRNLPHPRMEASTTTQLTQRSADVGLILTNTQEISSHHRQPPTQVEDCPSLSFRSHTDFHHIVQLAHMLDSLVRVSRRVEQACHKIKPVTHQSTSSTQPWRHRHGSTALYEVTSRNTRGGHHCAADPCCHESDRIKDTRVKVPFCLVRLDSRYKAWL